MIGVVIAGHGAWPQAMLSTAEMLMGKQPNISIMHVAEHESMEEIGRNMELAVSELNGKDEVLILLDMFGGSPANATVRFTENPDISAVTGTNMGMLLEVLLRRESMKLEELVEYAQAMGGHSIRNLFVELKNAGRDVS